MQIVVESKHRKAEEGTAHAAASQARSRLATLPAWSPTTAHGRMNHTEAAEESGRDPGDGGAAITGNGSEKTTGKSGGANLHARAGVILYLVEISFTVSFSPTFATTIPLPQLFSSFASTLKVRRFLVVVLTPHAHSFSSTVSLML